MITGELWKLILHEVDFSVLEDLAMVSAAYLSLVRKQLHCYPEQVNHLWLLLRMLPRKRWRWEWISFNDNITPRMVQHHPELPWDYFSLSGNSNFDPSCSLSPSWSSCWKKAWAMPSRLNLILINCFWSSWDDTFLSLNPHITWELVQSQPGRDWNYAYLSANKNITLEIILNNSEHPWSIPYYCRNPNLKWSEVVNHPELLWDYLILCEHPAITWEIVQAHPNHPWVYSKLLLNPSIKMETILNHPEIGWGNWKCAYQANPNWPVSEILKLPLEQIDYYYLSLNPTLTWEVVWQLRERPWYWSMLSLNTFCKVT